MNFKYLKSFTVLEVLISLILMSIIITLTYSIFNLVEKQMTLFENESTSVLQYNLFNTSIKNDINRAHNFSYVDNELSLEYYDDTIINYSLLKDYVLRQNHIKTDTFKLPILNYNFLSDDTSKPLSRTLQISIEVLGDTINTNYYLKKGITHTINSIYFNEMAITKKGEY